MIKMTNKNTVKISVRNLVEFILRSGDIDNSRKGVSDKEAMELGSRLHRKIQGSMGTSYQAEVSLKIITEFEEFDLKVEGRADGIETKNGQVIVDEIKGTFAELVFMKEAISVHIAQAKCYAYIYAKEHELNELTVQITYCNMETEDIKRFQERCSFDELDKWFKELINEYYKWALFEYEWTTTRNQSMEGLEFPFEYREGQRDLVTGVYASISRQKELFIQAPTGIGKTMSAVFPSVRAIGAGMGSKIFYLTAKTITRTVASEAFNILQGQGLKYKVIMLTAKEKMCTCDEMICNPDNCPKAKGHFDRINDAVYELLTKTDNFGRDELLEHSDKWQVCPHELGLDVSLWVDSIICDYNYVFDPRARLKRFFAENRNGEYIFLIDEAHNLVERGREMFSAVLYKEDFLTVKKLVSPYNQKLAQYLEKSNRQLLAYKRECDTYQVLPNIGGFESNLLKVMSELEKFLEEAPEGEEQEKVLDFYFEVRTFLLICELLDDNYVIYSKHDENGRFALRLYCVNPANNLQECLDKGNSTIFFSATLLPMQYYKTLFSTREDDFAITAVSPFEQANKQVLLGGDVSSKYTRRGPSEYAKFANYIHEIIHARRGNYLTFFPSYRFMEDVYAKYIEQFPEDEGLCLKQMTAMTEQNREDFLNEFTTDKAITLVGFCVMGGIFAEGIDLIGERLIGAIIVGTGLPQVNYEKEILMNFYNERGENGFDYAYRFPGMNKVLQAAGRVIRTDEDKGIIVLLDERFANRDYRGLFPADWNDVRRCSLTTVRKQVNEFWDRH